MPVTDLRVHRDDLVVSTQGRSFWILDDVTPLHALAAGHAPRARTCSPRATPTAPRWPCSGGDASLAENPPYGATFFYTLPPDPKGEVTLEITGPDGRPVAQILERQGPDAPPARDLSHDRPAHRRQRS